MGVEWNIGCLQCKKQIWFGSQKPLKWQGFQIGDENVKRFLFLHSLCSSHVHGNLLLTNDGTTKIPWEDTQERGEWSEDILSRTFCFDSLKNESIVCAYCSKRLDVDEESRNQNNLKKNQFLWFCTETCFDNYVESKKTESDNFIYDSTNDKLTISIENPLEVTCTNCKIYVTIDYQKDLNGKIRDFEYLALFLCEHLGHDHLLKSSLVKISKYCQKWKEYQY